MSNEEESKEDVSNQVEGELLRQQMEGEDKLRTIGLFGEVNSTKAEEIIYALYALDATKLKKKPVDYLDFGKGLVEELEPIELIISTEGGDATDMFSIYDTIRAFRGNMDIQTFGLGKVMSAGVAILAAGTVGKRKVTRNCRLMLHQASAGTVGSVNSMENELEEVKVLQDMYVRCVAENSNLSVKKIKKLFKSNANHYISAEQAVEYGIADEVV